MFDSSHWYDKEGKPTYEVIGANGWKRATTLADARKLNLVPSVTTVLSVLAKPALEKWKVQQGILAALTMPKDPEESEGAYLSRIMDDSTKQVTNAADEGTRIHDQLECSFKGLVVQEKYRPHVAAVRQRIAELFPNVSDWVSEKSFCFGGYGGKVDLHSPSTGIVVDFKGKDGDFSDGKKLNYDQHWQLSAYQVGLKLPRIASANLFFSRTHPDCVSHCIWSEKQMGEGWAVFKAAHEAWTAIKKYYPV